MSDSDSYDAAMEQLSMLAGGDAGILAELVQTWLDSSTARVGELRAGVAANDPHTAYRAAHTLKGSARTFGANDVARLALQLEKLTKGEPEITEEAREGAQDLDDAVTAAQARLREHLERIEG